MPSVDWLTSSHMSMRALRWPPSMGTCAPWMKLALGEARKATRLATSSGSQIRPNGMLPTASSCALSRETPLSRANAFSSPSHRSVLTGPGLTVLMRTPDFPYWSAIAEAKLMSAALAPPAVVSQGVGLRPSLPTTRTTLPLPCSLMRGSTDLQARTYPMNFRFRLLNHSSSVKFSRRPPGELPAQVTRISILPKELTVSSTARSTSSGLLMSPAIGIIFRSEEHTSELQSRQYLVCRLLLEKKKIQLKLHINLRDVRSHSSHSIDFDSLLCANNDLHG